MFGIEHFITFVGTALLLNLYPGPDSLYIISRSVSQGRLAGISAVLGISTGSLFHTLIGAIGLSAMILSSANAFMIIKYVGVAYLFYQAVIMFRESTQKVPETNFAIKNKRLLSIYAQGAITNILNPKVALFFMALLPQFISAQSPHKTLTFMVLGLMFIITGTLWCLLLALFASYFSEQLRANSKVSRWLLRVNALLFVYLGVQLGMIDNVVGD